LDYQPLDRLIKYFLETSDKRIIWLVAPKLLLASVTYKAVRDGKSIMSVIDKGKKTELEAPTELIEKLISRAKDHLRSDFGDLFF